MGAGRGGQTTEGIALLRAGLAAYRATGAATYVPFYLTLLAGAEGKANDLWKGDATLLRMSLIDEQRVASPLLPGGLDFGFPIAAGDVRRNLPHSHRYRRIRSGAGPPRLRGGGRSLRRRADPGAWSCIAAARPSDTGSISDTSERRPASSSPARRSSPCSCRSRYN